jgi:DNA-binding SARP family transcriptional activator
MATPGPAFHLKLLGIPEVEAQDGNQVEGIPSLGLGVLAYLSLDPRRHTRDHLASLLWAKAPRSRALHSLRQLLSKVRRLLPGVPLVDGDFVKVDASRLSVDVLAFENEVRWGRPEPALGLWRGPFMEGWGRGVSWELEDWVDRKGASLHCLLKTSVAEGAKAFMASGRPREAEALLEKAAQLLPTQDDLVLLRAQALAASGRLPEAEATLVDLEVELGDQRVRETLEEIEKWKVVALPPVRRYMRPADA